MSRFKLFEQTEPYGVFLANPDKCRWFEYSSDFYSVLPLLKRAFLQHGGPLFVHIPNKGLYNYTFAVDLSKIDSKLREELQIVALALYDFPVGNGLNFFHSLINKRVRGELFGFLFAYFREVFVGMSENAVAALYPPLTITNDENDFPLHCDLYPPKMLFNVFESPSKGNDGISLFLKTSTLLTECLPTVKHVGKPFIEKAKGLIFDETGEDRYEAFYSLLYGNQWSNEVKRTLNETACKIKFNKGQGYLINDRKWMHGRGETRQAPSIKRLHRLVFR